MMNVEHWWVLSVLVHVGSVSRTHVQGYQVSLLSVLSLPSSLRVSFDCSCVFDRPRGAKMWRDARLNGSLVYVSCAFHATLSRAVSYSASLVFIAMGFYLFISLFLSQFPCRINMIHNTSLSPPFLFQCSSRELLMHHV